MIGKLIMVYNKCYKNMLNLNNKTNNTTLLIIMARYGVIFITIEEVSIIDVGRGGVPKFLYTTTTIAS